MSTGRPLWTRSAPRVIDVDKIAIAISTRGETVMKGIRGRSLLVRRKNMEFAVGIVTDCADNSMSTMYALNMVSWNNYYL
jgi:hypothetical protein